MGARRIGQYLLDAGLVTPGELDEALKTQVLHGARLGTNLVEHAHVDLDELALFLGEQHGLPPALETDFERADARFREALAPELAARWLCVPLYLDDTGLEERVVVAARDPLSQDAIDALETALGLAIAPTIAPELRIFYHLESFYGFERPNRFKRVRGEDSIELPIFFEDELEEEQDDLELEAPADRGSSGSHPTRERRHFVSTLSEVDEAKEPSREILARVRIRRASGQFAGARDPGADLSNVTDAIKAIKRATGRDRVGDILVETLRDGFDREFEVAMVLVLRENLAVGWKGFVRDGLDGLVELVAIPLSSASTVAAVYHAQSEYVGAPAPGSEVEVQLWTALEVSQPGCLVTIPVELFGEIVCFIYVHTQADAVAPAHVELLRKLGAAVTSAFQRLTRAAQR